MAHRNMATFIAASNLGELLERMGADVPLELFDKHRFAIEVARAIEGGMLNGQGSVAMLGFMTMAYADLTVAYWEACEERHRANEAFQQAQAAARQEERKPETLDEVLADRPPRYRGGDVVEIRNERWTTSKRAVVQRADWREEELNTWFYTVQVEGEGGTYAIHDDDPNWDIDFAK